VAKYRLAGSDPVSQTLMIPLYARALEQQQPEPLVRDPLCAQVMAGIDFDWNSIKVNHYDLLAMVVRLRQFDRATLAFLGQHPQATVVHIGAGMDTRFQRVDNGQVRWFNLDLPEVIDLRRKLLPSSPREHNLGCSAFDLRWLDLVSAPGALLLVAEAVLTYFEQPRVRELVVALRNRYPGSVLVTDTATPLSVRLDNLHLVRTRSAARMHWSCRDPRDVTAWAPGIELLESFYYFDDPEPRLGLFNLWRFVPAIAKGSGIHTYRLG
jgi:O-methyltransferase involved in polyketide biosynthesis